jgi:hypothetical protein
MRHNQETRNYLMPLFAIKKLPLNMSGMVTKIENPMSTRTELGEFEVEAESIEAARELAKSRVSPDEPNMICPWRDKTNCFTVSANREFVHPITLYSYNGKGFNEFVGNCHCDQPLSGKFMSKNDAKADYLAHKCLADKKIDAALTHLKAMNDLGVSIDYHMDGDTHGIYEDYMYLEVNEGPYCFVVKYND